MHRGVRFTLGLALGLIPSLALSQPFPSTTQFTFVDDLATPSPLFPGQDGRYHFTVCDQIIVAAAVADTDTGLVTPAEPSFVDIQTSNTQADGGMGPFESTGDNVTLTNGAGMTTAIVRGAGNFDVRGLFAGDAALDPSSSQPMSVTVDPRQPQVSASPSGSRVVLPVNAVLKYEAQVMNPLFNPQGCDVLPSGLVALEVNGSPVSFIPLQPMQPTHFFLFSSPVPGTFTLQVRYQGDGNFTSQVALPLEVTVADTVVTLTTVQPGTDCAAGGTRIDVGPDVNGDGAATGSEVIQTRNVCNGADGAAGAPGTNGTNGADGLNGVSTLVDVMDELPGNNCPAGGKAIHVGMDVDADGTLDAGEVTETRYVCNGVAGASGLDGLNGTNGTDGAAGAAGANGVEGTNGTNGKNSLVAVTDEAAGANCATGGKAIQVGLDDNANGTLDTEEIDATSYVCNGAKGPVGDSAVSGSCAATGAVAPAWMLALGLAGLLRRRRA